MVHRLPLLLTLLTLPSTSSTTITCPTPTSRHGTTSGPLALSSSTVTLTNTPSTGTLCTLFTTTTSFDGRKTFYIPVGRSYDGHDWERVAGRYNTLEYTCGSGSCTVDLPDTDTQQYYVTSYAYTLTPSQISARFFERASFGATSSMLSLATTEAEMAEWIRNQFDENLTPVSSHREYFRKRLNPRMLEMGKFGRTGPKVCDLNSRWRNFAFTKKDYVISSGKYEKYWPIARHNMTIETKTISSTTKYLLRFAGHIRTMLDSPPVLSDTDAPITDGSYIICGADELPGTVYSTEDERKLYAKFQLEINGECQDVKGGNPQVSIDPAFLVEEPSGGHIVDFSSVPTAQLPSIGFGFEDTVKLLNVTDFYEGNVVTCDGFPDPEKSDYRSSGWEYSPFYEGRRHPNWDNATAIFLDEPVYALMPDNTYYLHDRRFTPLQNTPTDPLSDGGGTMTMESIYRDINSYNSDDGELLPVDVDDNPRTKSELSGNEQAIFCSNGPPNIFNEDTCTLSTDPNACVRMKPDDEDTVVVVKLVPLALSKINTHANTSMFQIQGLEFVDGTPKPCGDGVVSRWVVQDGITTRSACDALSPTTVETETYSAFTDLLYYSVSSNDVLRDVSMHEKFQGMGCNDLDRTKYGFSIFDYSSSKCFLNVHPEDYDVYYVRDETAVAKGADGVISWVGSGLTMEYWESVIDDSELYDYYGRSGDVELLESMMERLGVYVFMGGKPVTRAPTTTPSESPSYYPSQSLAPVLSSDAPSEFPSFTPSETQSPSDNPSGSISPSISGSPSSSPSNKFSSASPSESTSPSSQPSSLPSSSSAPSTTPTEPQYPSDVPSATPSLSTAPSESPSTSLKPSSFPSDQPSFEPSASAAPSSVPSDTIYPSASPTQWSHVARTFNDNVFHDIANDPDITYIILESEFAKKTGGVLVCGSEGEIAPDPAEDNYFDYWTRRLDSTTYYGEQKKTVWTQIALEENDQLVQRIAFALSQIFAISPEFLGYTKLSEAYTYYYDIFVRHGTTTYREVLKNVAYSIKMGMQLSHVGSKSLRYYYDSYNKVRFPDENYAREVMQLETIGLEMLNKDGTVIKDSRGEPVPTYDTEDIIVFSRAWTGFDRPIRRGNYEELDNIEINWMDPMTLDGRGRDWFPKRDLLDGWIGDRHPLCADLPAKHFLKTGATYKLLGRSSAPRYHFDNPAWDGDETITRMTLNPSSNLLALLCAESNGSCTYPASVTLSSDISCYGLECELDTMRVVQVAPYVFYEYVRRPCVHFAFLDNARSVYAGRFESSLARMCADPSQPIATTTCCYNNDDNPVLSCVYTGDFVTYDTNTQRCGGDTELCPASIMHVDRCGTCCDQTNRYISTFPEYNFYQWSEGTCSYQVKVHEDSSVAIVHVPQWPVPKVAMHVENSEKNMNYFAVTWPTDSFLGDKVYPTIDNDCGNQTCIAQEDNTCLCNVVVTNSMAFTSEPADADTIRSTLKIGAFEPDYFEAGLYGSAIVHSSDNSISIFHLASVNGYSQDTIFMLPDEFGGETIYLKNLISTIEIGDDNNGYFVEPLRKPLIMRNPLSFFDLVKPETRDAVHETEAVIDHYMHHPNAAPFISMQLIQHIAGISNPGPAYINRVADAFTSGSFESNGITFGTGKLSDMQAVVAAILLDQEATANILDADPAYGGIKEPIIKVLQYFRAMGYQHTAWGDRNIYPKLYDMAARVGQMAHESPDQFSFFLPDYSTPGQLAQAALYAPAAQVLTLSTTISTIEGLFSLARQGLSTFDGGFGAWISMWGAANTPTTGEYSHSVGFLNFSPSGSTTNEQVQEIADLLTSGRLSADEITAIATAVDAEATLDTKIRLAQQIIATAPEFHTTNLANRNGNPRSPTPTQDALDIPYKAIVILHLSGGLDSFNVLMPHPVCPKYSYYRKAREVLALGDDDMLNIWNPNPISSPCQTMGVNKNIPILKEIYDDGKGIFMANIGHLAKPVTKNNWYTETKTHLFSHKTMEREAQLVDAFQEDGWSTGVVGRMLDKLQEQGMSVSASGIDQKGFIIEGNPANERTVDVIPSSGVNTLTRRSLSSEDYDLAGIESIMSYLNQETDIASGIFANYWAQNLVDTVDRANYLDALVESTTLINQDLFVGQVGRKLDIVSRMILQREQRKVNRDAFYIQMGNYDGHALTNSILAENLPIVDQGLTAFYREMGNQSLLDNVTFVLISEFGRTISPNSGLGSDHAWGGNAFLFGGEVAGGKILGQYPERLDNLDSQNIGRGRLIPARSWESMWYGIANWFGITDSKEIEYVLPNNGNMGCQLYSDKDMYTTGNVSIPGCNDRGVTMKLGMFLKEPRYLTGMEQKRICKAAIAKVSNKANVTSRCIVVDQQVIVSIDENNRRRLHSDFDVRFLEDANATNATYTVEAEVSILYDDTTNGTGAAYIENADTFTTDMNQELTGNCSGTCEFQIDNVAEVTAFEAQVTEAPSSSPSISFVPSSQPSSQPSHSPSNVPSVSAQPSESPSLSSQPSSEPSSNPSESAMPSGSPSTSTAPSKNPSGAPFSSPSSSPSSNPSSQPSHNPSESPSESLSPSSNPSSQPSTGPSKNPSAIPSSGPSSQPSFEPSSQPSSNPSSVPSSQPSSVPSLQPSVYPSDNPSFQPSPYPSLHPSQRPSSDPSLHPSSDPTDTPSNSPSGHPSESPSNNPSDSPSQLPTKEKIPSSSPSDSPTSQPSTSMYPSKPPSIPPSDSPSASPSSFPSRDCPATPDSCGNGGIWSPYICECLCIRPFCPSDTGLQCSNSICSADYYQNVFKDCTHDCPWFKHGDACLSGEDVPVGTKAIYRSKSSCCESEFPSDTQGCEERTGGLYHLRYNARFTMSGTDCSSSAADKARAALDLAKITIASVCSKVPGIGCEPGDKVVVNKFCGQDVQHEVDYQNSSRLRFLSSPDNDVVEYTLILNGIAESDIRQKDSLLGQYLQGSTLDTILTEILNQITSTSSTQSIQSISAIYYEFMGSFIEGLGLYYPAWGVAETCLNDGQQPDYMNSQPSLWMLTDLESCCAQYYSWNKIGCLEENAQANTISGSGSGTGFVDPTADLYYPDWSGANTCVNDGNAPPYMKTHSQLWMYASREECCKKYYTWENDYAACMASQGSSIPTQTPVEGWYVQWDSYQCVKSCEGSSPCGGIGKKWNILHDTKERCCQEHLWWAGRDCMA